MTITKLESSRDFLRIWFFWKMHAAVVFFLIVGCVMVYAFTATTKYESRAKVLLLPRTHQDLIITAGDAQRQVIKSVTPEDLNTEMYLMLSDSVLENTIHSFPDNAIGLNTDQVGLVDRITGWISDAKNRLLSMVSLANQKTSEQERKTKQLRNAIDIAIYESNIMEISLRAQDPKQAAVVLGRLIEKYIDHHDQVFSLERGVQFYDDQTEIFKERLDKAEQALKRFENESAIVNFKEQNTANIELLTELKKGLQLLEIEYDESKSRLEIFEKGLFQSSDVLITKEMRSIPSIIELENSIVPLLLKKSSLSKTFTPKSREIKDVDTQIAMIRSEIANEIRKAFKTDKLELESKKIKMESLGRKIEALNKEALSLKAKEKILLELQRQVDMHKRNYQLYASKTEDSRVYSERKKQKLSNITIADKPSMSFAPVAPKKMLLLILSVFFGLIAAALTPFVIETLDHKLKTIDDVEKLLSLPVISSFPETKIS